MSNVPQTYKAIGIAKYHDFFLNWQYFGAAANQQTELRFITSSLHVWRGYTVRQCGCSTILELHLHCLCTKLCLCVSLLFLWYIDATRNYEAVFFSAASSTSPKHKSNLSQHPLWPPKSPLICLKHHRNKNCFLKIQCFTDKQAKRILISWLKYKTSRGWMSLLINSWHS